MSSIDDTIRSIVRDEIRAALAESGQSAHQNERLLRVAEVAEELRISKSRAWQLVSDGSIRSTKIGRHRVVPAPALDEYIAGLGIFGEAS